jgi:glycyl-tRNA synthetase alpha subunit
MPAARASSGKSFQALILELQRFWADQGCVLL